MQIITSIKGSFCNQKYLCFHTTFQQEFETQKSHIAHDAFCKQTLQLFQPQRDRLTHTNTVVHRGDTMHRSNTICQTLSEYTTILELTNTHVHALQVSVECFAFQALRPYQGCKSLI